MVVNIQRGGGLSVAQADGCFPGVQSLRNHDRGGGVMQSVKRNRAKVVRFYNFLKFLCWLDMLSRQPVAPVNTASGQSAPKPS